MTTTAIDIDYLATWKGRQESRSDVMIPTPLAAMSATLDRDDAEPATGDAVPPLWHWLYFLPRPMRRAIGPDGHAERGGFLPPVPLQRRMWAGSQLEFHQPLRVGDTVRRESTIADVTVKHGRTGPLVFVKVQHDYHGAQGLAVTEFHDIVYREPAVPGAAAPAPQAAPADPVWTRDVVPDEVLLFRYSALTFNGHRIHYDHPYVTQVEGYAGLVVHGPLIATLVLDHLRDRLAAEAPDRSIRSFSFRAVQPTVHTEPFAVCAQPEDAALSAGSTVRLWARKADGSLTMQATAGVV